MGSRRWIAATLALACASSVSTMASEPTVRMQRSDRSWTGSVVLDTVRGGHLVYREDGVRDSIAVSEVGVVRRPRSSHVLGGAIGMLGGATAGIALGLGVLMADGPHSRSDFDLPIVIFGLATAGGTILGAALGVPVHPTNDLDLDGLDAVQREGALSRFILDEHLRAAEP